jgi:hypothetical protein
LQQIKEEAMRNVVVFCLMICASLTPVLPAPVDDVAGQGRSDSSQLSEKELNRQARLREKAELFGPGAQIQILMRGSAIETVYKGEIDEISANSLKLKTKDLILPIMYGQIESLNLIKRRYRANGKPDPVQVRRVAADIGIGEKATVDLVSSAHFSGKIESIDKESLTMNSQGRPQQIRFSEVKGIKRSQFPVWKQAVLGVGIGFAAVAIFMAIVIDD